MKETPLSYRDIKQIVLQRIQARTWPPDSLMPSEADLAEEFSSTRTTVNRALRELADEGYLERKRKAGTRVLNMPQRKARLEIPLVSDEVEATGASYRYSLVERRQQPAPDWLAARLGLAQGQQVLYIRCMHYADQRPFQLETRWIVVQSVPEVVEADFSSSGPNGWLLQTVPFTEIELAFMAGKAGKEAEFLEAEPDAPVFTVERCTWHGGDPVTLARLQFAPGYRMTTRIS